MSEFEFWKDLGNIFDAVLNYQKKNVEFNNRFINPWIRLGNVFDRQDKTNDAVDAYQRTTEIDPDTAQNWVDLGDAQFKNGSYDEAIEAYGKAVMLDPNAGWALGNLALCMVSQGNFEEAIPLYQKSIELLTEAKDKAICWNRLGNAYRKLNDYENAFLAFQKADAFDGENTGFSDKLDEAPPSAEMVAPEEILEQMIEEQIIENSESTALETMNESVQETVQAKAELESNDLTELENTDELSALVPIMKIQVFDETEVEAPVDILQVINDVISNVELAYAQQEIPVVEEIQAKEVTAEIDENAIAENVELAYAQQEMPIVEEIQAEEVAAEIDEDTIAKFESSVAIEEITLGGESVAELAMHETTKEEEKTLAIEIEIQEEPAQADSVTILSEISQVAVVSDSVVNMDIVETYTESLSVQAATESSLSEESIPETADQLESPHEAGMEAFEMAAMDESIADEESMMSEGQISELAYEEYLKDMVEPRNILTDNAGETQTETPVTKVSKNGEVRIEMDTKNAHVWNELGNIYLNANAYDDAIVSYSKAIELDRHFAWPYSNLALAYVQKSRFAEAILLYQRGIELFASDKDKAVTWNRLGNVYRRVNDYNNAIASYQNADELDPENATLSLRLSFGLLGNMSPDIKPAYVA